MGRGKGGEGVEEGFGLRGRGRKKVNFVFRIFL